jgi:hypothetical protein
VSVGQCLQGKSPILVAFRIFQLFRLFGRYVMLAISPLRHSFSRLPRNPGGRKMSGYIVQICASHDPIKPKAWLAVSNDAAPSVVYDRNCARVFETADEARSAAMRVKKSKCLVMPDFLVRQKRRAA